MKEDTTDGVLAANVTISEQGQMGPYMAADCYIYADEEEVVVSIEDGPNEDHEAEQVLVVRFWIKNRRLHLVVKDRKKEVLFEHYLD